LSRQGRTAWVEDRSGGFIPVPGARRQPKFLAEVAGAREGFAVVERDVREICAGREVGELRNARAIFDYLSPIAEKQSQEVFLVCPLDIKAKPLSAQPFLVAMGQNDRVAVEVADVLRPVIETNSSGFIVSHNHPSGSAKPSQADRKLTSDIRKAAQTACPSSVFLDHIVLGHSEYFSFTENKLVKV
jgi:DNA repair protein RadC